MDLKQTLTDHSKWLLQRPTGARADLSNADLRGTYLRSAELRYANLIGVDLRDADLGDAYLRGANLIGADLRNADLRNVDLRGANLKGADMRNADLRGANLRFINLIGADLRGADLRDANLRNALLIRANLKGATLPSFQTPQGDLVGWKKLQEGVVARLRVPPAAKRTATLVGRGCRAEFVEVVSLEGPSDPLDRGYSLHDNHPYKVGEFVYPDSYDDDIRVECTHGIHFFLTEEEA